MASPSRFVRRIIDNGVEREMTADEHIIENARDKRLYLRATGETDRQIVMVDITTSNRVTTSTWKFM